MKSTIENTTHYVRLWFGSDEPQYRHWTARAQGLVRQHATQARKRVYFTEDETARNETCYEARLELAEEMASATKHRAAELTRHSNLYDDLLQWTLRCVDWQAVADDFVTPATDAEFE